MKNIFKMLLLVGAIKVYYSTTLEARVNDLNGIEEVKLITTEPRFTELGNSLFLAVKTDNSLTLKEGTVVEFIFKKKNYKTYHVNDSNQDVLDKGDADLLVMVHQDLAVALGNEKLLGIKVVDGDEVSFFNVEEYWQPHNYISQF